MQVETPDQFSAPRALVIGAGFGGLSAALMLRASGHDVLLLDQHDWLLSTGHVSVSPPCLYVCLRVCLSMPVCHVCLCGPSNLEVD